MADYMITPARYAKGKMVLRPTSDGSGYKTRACYLAEALGGKWVGRSNGYTMSPAAAAKFEKLYAAGFDANVRLFSSSKPSFLHHDRNLRDLTAAEALRAIEPA